MRAWRARTNRNATSRAISRQNFDTIELPLSTDVENLALHRLIYDFSGSHNALEVIALGKNSLESRASDENRRLDNEGFQAAFLATSLANFYSRHRDSRAASLEVAALHKALVTLGRLLQSCDRVVTLNLVLMAILLGLHQVCTLCSQPSGRCSIILTER